jgi:hypothetical protein
MIKWPPHDMLNDTVYSRRNVSYLVETKQIFQCTIVDYE